MEKIFRIIGYAIVDVLIEAVKEIDKNTEKSIIKQKGELSIVPLSLIYFL